MEIKRDKYLNDLIVRMHNGLVKVVTGVRRCGKSYLVFHLFRDYLLRNGVDEDHIIGIELDLRKNRRYRDPDSFKKIVVVKDVVKITRDEKGITTISLYDFLLNEGSLDL